MTDSNDDDSRGRPPRGRSDRTRSSGDRPPRKPRDGDRPFRNRDGGDRPFRSRDSGDRPFRARRDEDKAPRSRDSDRPRKPREGGDRPFRPRAPEGDRPFRSRGEGGDRPFRSRPQGDRPFRGRRDEGADRPFRPRPDGDRPFRGRREDDGGRKSFGRPRDDRPRRPREEQPEQRPEEPAEDRIAKVIARAGIASRRDAEAMIAEGRVTLNGEVLTSPAVNVTAADTITVDGEPLPAKERTRLWLFHKPRGLVTTARDPEGRPTVFENLPDDLPRVVAVGRLDINTEGLLLLTNDGGLARVIAHPETGWMRRYKVRAHGEITQADLDKLRDGITIDGIEYGPIEARLDREQGDNVWITMGLREGKNREIKRILEHLGLQVNRLIRVSFGPFQLGDLESGLVEEVRTKVLKEQLGQTLAAEAGVDFESPVREPIAPFGSPKRSEQRERNDRPPGGRSGRWDRDGAEERSPRERRDEEAKAPRPRNERSSTVWRDEETEARPRKGSKAPRRGADPKAARAATAERPRERIGAIDAGERKVVVERLVSVPKDDAEPPAHRSRSPRHAPSGDDRPRRRDDRSGPREARSREDGRPPRKSFRDDRPARRDDDRPPRSGPGRGGPGGGRPGRGGPDRGGPGRTGPGRGGPKGGQKGRRP